MLSIMRSPFQRKAGNALRRACQDLFPGQTPVPGNLLFQQVADRYQHLSTNFRLFINRSGRGRSPRAETAGKQGQNTARSRRVSGRFPHSASGFPLPDSGFRIRHSASGFPLPASGFPLRASRSLLPASCFPLFPLPHALFFPFAFLFPVLSSPFLLFPSRLFSVSQLLPFFRASPAPLSPFPKKLSPCSFH